MNKLIISFALSFAAFAANATNNDTDAVTVQVEACKANAGAFNGPEKAACIQVAQESAAFAKSANTWVHPVVKQIAFCKANAGAMNTDEKKGCIEAAVLEHVGYCVEAAGSPLMTEERNACVRVTVEAARGEAGGDMMGVFSFDTSAF
jgi:hypothetical protein